MSYLTFYRWGIRFESLKVPLMVVEEEEVEVEVVAYKEAVEVVAHTEVVEVVAHTEAV